MNRNRVKVINVKHAITKRIVSKFMPVIEAIKKVNVWTLIGFVTLVMAAIQYYDTVMYLYSMLQRII